MELTQNMRNSRHISDFAHRYFDTAAYSGTPAVLGPPVELILTIGGEDVFTIGLGKLITTKDTK